MATVEIDTGTYVKRYDFWNPATWSIPKLYWDAYSQEQRLHAICRQLEKVIKYADYLGVNTDDIAARLKAIEDGQLNELIVAAIEAWFEENEPEIIQAIENLQEDIQTLQTSIEAETQNRIDADTAINDTIIEQGDEIESNFEYAKERFSIPNSIEAMKPLFRYENNNLWYTQGGDTFEYEGTRYFVEAHAKYNDESAGKITITRSDGLQTASLETSLIGHGQNVTYINGQAWITNRKLSDTTSNSGFAVFDITPSSIVFNRIVYIPGFVNIFDATLDDEYYYLIEDMALNKVDRQTGEIVVSKTMAELDLMDAGNGISLNDKYNAIVVNSATPYRIGWFDRDTLELIGQTNYKNVYGYVKMFESEWIKTVGDDVYMGVFGGYSYTGGVGDVAPTTIMYTNLRKNIGLNGTCRDLRANIGDSLRVTVNLDYTADINTLPETVTDGMTVKYAQDIEALVILYQAENSFNIVLAADYPGELVLNNFNGFMNISRSIGGIRLFGGTPSISAGNTAFADGSANWLRGRGILLWDACATVILGAGSYTGTNLLNTSMVMLVCNDAVWTHSTHANTGRIAPTT